MIFRRFAAVAAVALAAGAPAFAQVNDHLQCYKIKDTSLVLKGTVDLDDTISGALSPCKISSAKMFCTGSAKSNPTVFNITTPVTVLPHSGIEIPADQNRICYKVSCPKLDPPEANQTVTDQFGSHALTKLKTSMVCTPAVIGTGYCGDGTVSGDEQCDGTDLNGGTCVTAGLGSGTLACGPGCRYDTSGCTEGKFPASGQTTCYNATGGVIACAGTAQDGEKQAGATLAYQDNGDGTVTDLNTGLMWEKQSDDASIHDRDQLFTWANAPTHITALNSGGFAGHNDWRLPNARELLSLVDYGAANPAIETTAFHSNCFGGCTVSTCSCTAFFAYWTSTTVTNLPNSAFAVNFTDGTVGVFTKNASFTAAVRGVRGGPQ
jgi:Protein of unknown function (DUF1566)